MGDIDFDVGGGSKKSIGWWGAPPLWETLNDKPHLGGNGGMKECLNSTLQIYVNLSTYPHCYTHIPGDWRQEALSITTLHGDNTNQNGARYPICAPNLGLSPKYD